MVECKGQNPCLCVQKAEMNVEFTKVEAQQEKQGHNQEIKKLAANIHTQNWYR